MEQLKSMISNQPMKFENDFRNLKSFVIDLENEQKRIEMLKKIEQD